MTHECEYCNKVLLPCSSPCSNKQDKNHVCCTCPLESCEMDEKHVCNAPLCNFKEQVFILTQELASTKDQLRLKDLVNHYRIMGISPASLETLIQKEGINIPHVIFLNKDEQFHWGQMLPEDCYTFGAQMMRNFEQLSKLWADFLNVHFVKAKIKIDQIASTKSKIAKNQEQTLGKIDNKGKEKTAKQKKATLNNYEKLIVHDVTKIGMTQAQAEEYLKTQMKMTGEARDLKALGII